MNSRALPVRWYAVALSLFSVLTALPVAAQTEEYLDEAGMADAYRLFDEMTITLCDIDITSRRGGLFGGRPSVPVRPYLRARPTRTASSRP